LQVRADQWLLLPEARSAASNGTAITYDGTPQQRAEKLAAAIADRVDSWGLALSGGYWKPILVVEVDPAVEWRFDQLRQLLAGSGLEIQRE
jgi:hypothetical protein